MKDITYGNIPMRDENVLGVSLGRSRLTHKQRIMLLLATGHWVSARALNAICFRYSARIFELRRAGFAVEMQRAPDGSVFYRHVK